MESFCDVKAPTHTYWEPGITSVGPIARVVSCGKYIPINQYGRCERKMPRPAKCMGEGRARRQ